mgnify:CR=1 FL=1
MFDYIPDYNPDVEKAKKPREDTLEVNGIRVGDTVIDPETLYKLASIGASNRELADWFGTSESQIRYYFTQYLQKARAALNMKLRRAQLKVAIEKENPALLIFLGKAMLGMSENAVTSETEKTLPWISEQLEDQLPDIPELEQNEVN